MRAAGGSRRERHLDYAGRARCQRAGTCATRGEVRRGRAGRGDRAERDRGGRAVGDGDGLKHGRVAHVGRGKGERGRGKLQHLLAGGDVEAHSEVRRGPKRAWAERLRPAE